MCNQVGGWMGLNRSAHPALVSQWVHATRPACWSLLSRYLPSLPRSGAFVSGVRNVLDGR